MALPNWRSSLRYRTRYMAPVTRRTNLSGCDPWKQRGSLTRSANAPSRLDVVTHKLRAFAFQRYFTPIDGHESCLRRNGD